jgi:2-dehydro-3-deoxy-D-arabinonate dehydratase
MYLTRHQTKTGAGWALNGKLLPEQFNLSFLLELPRASLTEVLSSLPTSQSALGQLLPPLEPLHEVWASGVTYLRSRDARQAESEVGDVYAKVYDAPRPELFLKAVGWRVVGHQMPIHIRGDSHWNVPEPELTLVINRHLEIVGYCVGNDVSSRAIEGENPLYLSQAKIYNGACALGPGLILTEPDQLRDVAIQLNIHRADRSVFQGEVRSSQMKRSLEELVTYLGKELDFPHGVFLMTGTGLVPSDDFTLQAGDVVQITVGSLTLQNEVR